MDKKMNVSNLLEIRKKLWTNETLALFTKNKNNGWECFASFWTNGQDRIGVYEGAGDGSDDKDMSFEEFLENYDYELKEEL